MELFLLQDADKEIIKRIKEAGRLVDNVRGHCCCCCWVRFVPLPAGVFDPQLPWEV